MEQSPASAQFVLGTAQIGSSQNAPLIVRSAVQAGIRWIETSPRYEGSERAIGSSGASHSRLRIVTKFDAQDGAISMRDNVESSCRRLGLDRLDILVIDAADLSGQRGRENWRSALELRGSGQIFDLGVAVATPEDALKALGAPEVRYLQLQFNALDWRWRDSGVIEALTRRRDVVVHAHSVLMQGTLAAHRFAKSSSDDRSAFAGLQTELWRLAREMNRDCPADLCIAYARAQSWIQGVIVGVKSFEQLALNIARFKRPALSRAECTQVSAVLPRVPVTVLDRSTRIQAA